jgi:hypothetical protein
MYRIIVLIPVVLIDFISFKVVTLQWAMVPALIGKFAGKGVTMVELRGQQDTNSGYM